MSLFSLSQLTFLLQNKILHVLFDKSILLSRFHIMKSKYKIPIIKVEIIWAPTYSPIGTFSILASHNLIAQNYTFYTQGLVLLVITMFTSISAPNKTVCYDRSKHFHTAANLSSNDVSCSMADCLPLSTSQYCSVIDMLSWEAVALLLSLTLKELDREEFGLRLAELVTLLAECS